MFLYHSTRSDICEIPMKYQLILLWDHSYLYIIETIFHMLESAVWLEVTLYVKNTSASIHSDLRKILKFDRTK